MKITVEFNRPKLILRHLLLLVFLVSLALSITFYGNIKSIVSPVFAASTLSTKISAIPECSGQIPCVLGTSTSTAPYQNINSDVQISGNLYIANNNNSSTYKLGTAIGDVNHYIYSTGTNGNNTYFGEWGGDFHFRDTSTGNDIINTPGHSVQITGNGGLNKDLTVTGRIQTGDGGNAGGMWVNSANTRFVGDSGDGVGTFTSGQWTFKVTDSKQICLNGSCISSWPTSSAPLPGYLTRLLTIYSPNQCDGNFIYTLSSSEKFPTQVDAVEGINSSGGSNPSNTNATVDSPNAQQLHVWSGVGSCSNTPATFFIMVFGH